MNKFSGESLSYWNEAPTIPHHTPLNASPSVDVCIIGAGIAGLTAAYLLLRAGKSVIVVEQGKIAGGDTGRTTAHLSPIMDDGLAEIEKWHGLDGAKKAYQSHCAAIDLIEKIVADEKIKCDFLRVDGYLYAENSDEEKNLDEELKAAKRAQIKVTALKKTAIRGFGAGPCLRFPDQAQFHVTKYLKALAHIIVELGGKIYDQTQVNDIKQGSPAQVKTKSGHNIKADFVIEAANSLVSGAVRTITKLFPYRTFVVAAEIPRDSVPTALFWDMKDPYHYVRTQPIESNSKFDLLIVGGEDHKTGQKNDAEVRYEKLELWARERWPQMGQIKYRWSGQCLETPDGLALIGVNPGNEKNSFLITGDSGHGITHGTLGAMILSDIILEKENPYQSLYSPERFHVSSAKNWVQENANVAGQYMNWITKKDEVKTVDDIKVGEGAVITKGLSKIAVYKDPAGKVHACSAVCTHLGGIVKWNSEEKTWDCPCHGSRFDPSGKVIATPAVEDLKKVSLR